MSAEFNWWLLIVGLVVGAGLTWLVLADSRRREEDLEEAELESEAAWLETATADLGTPVDAAIAEQLLRLHRTYLGLDDDAIRPTADEPAATAGEPDATSPAATAGERGPTSPPGPQHEPDPPVGTPG